MHHYRTKKKEEKNTRWKGIKGELIRLYDWTRPNGINIEMEQRKTKIRMNDVCDGQDLPGT